MHHIFTIQELVDQIVSEVPPSQSTAFVSRTWFFASLPSLWKVVWLTKALKLLGEMKDEPNGYSFLQDKPPTPAQWDRFFMHSKHVRALIGSDYDITAFATAIRFLPNNKQCMFTGLRSLKWNLVMGIIPGIERSLTPTDLTVLLSPSLEILSLDLRDIPLPFFGSLCDTLINRVRALRVLQICLIGSVTLKEERQCVNLFNQVLQSFKQTLTYVQMPKDFYTDEIAETLGKSPNLRNLAIGRPSQVGYDEDPSKYPDHDEEVEEDFGILKTLSFTGSQRALCDRFLDKQKFSYLSDIYWNLPMKIEDPKSFFTAIAKACPKLCLLSVGAPDAYADEDALPPIIPWEFIRVLLDCQCFSALSLHCCRVSMNKEDWIELLTGCKTWRNIHVYSVTPLPLSDLAVFAEYCPLLKALGIYVDVRSVNDVNPDDTPLPPSISPHALTSGSQGPCHIFRNLNYVNFGNSEYYPDLGPNIASFILGMCQTEHVQKRPYVTGWYWPLRKFNSYMSAGGDDIMSNEDVTVI